MFPHKETMTFCIIKNRATCYITCFPILANTQIHVFATSGGVCRAYAVAPLPCYKNGIHKIRMYPGRGVLHTPPERFQRRRRGVPIHKNDHSPPPAAFVRRMQYAPTLPENLKSKNKNESGIRVGAYCIRPTNILSMIILCYTKTRLRRLRRRRWGVCNTPLPYRKI